MSNHPNRNWRSKWRVCLETLTATHKNGWVFKFSPALECIEHPNPLLRDDLLGAPKLVHQAEDLLRESLEEASRGYE